MKITVIHMNHNQHLPLYKQVYQSLRGDILNGHMKQGDQLPSLRSMAKQLQISRTSIERAFHQLEIEGYIQGVAKRGYFICANKNDIQLRKQIVIPPKIHKQLPRFDFRTHRVDQEAFDTTIWKRYMKDILEQKEIISSYGAVGGEWELRLALQQYAFSARGVVGDINQFVIGASFQTLLSLICGMLDQDSVVGMEVGSFPQAQQIFKDFRIPIYYIDSDDEDLMIAQLKQYKVTVFYCHSASFGSHKTAMKEGIRKALITWAKVDRHWIIEDDHNGEFCHGEQMCSALQGYDRQQHTIYFGSFSKLLLPSLRIAYMVLPPTYTSLFQKRSQYYNASASKLEQLALARYIGDGHLEKQVRRLRKHYVSKQEMMKQYLDRFFQGMHYEVNQAGLCYHLYLEATVCKAIMKECEKQDILIQEDDRSLLLSYAAISLDDMEKGLMELCVIVNEVCERLN